VRRVASTEPATMRANPSTIPTVSGSLRNTTPSASATAGLTYVMTVARAAPTSATSGKKTTNPRAVQITPSTAEEGQTLELPRDDQRSDRVAEGNERHLAHRADVARTHVQADERRDAEETQPKTDDAADIDAVVAPGGPREDRADRRDQCNKETGQGA
jgi:hypothetical protein